MTRGSSASQRLSCDLLARVNGQVLEGPCWDARTNRLLFVDIPAGTVHALDWASGSVTSASYSESVSAVIPREQGGEIVACRRGIAMPYEQRLTLLVHIETERQWTRTNDAKCDPAGRLWVGTMADDEKDGAASLYRVSQDLERTTVVDGVTISNGLGWSPDQTQMYYIDSPTRRVDVFDYDVATGEASNRRTLVDTSGITGVPDGLSVDAEGGIWVAFYGGSAVTHFAPDGTLLTVVDVPTPKVTSCAFAGSELDHLVITTAGGSDIQATGSAGDLFVTRPGVTGLPTVAFGG